jgi:hypothetical protein
MAKMSVTGAYGLLLVFGLIYAILAGVALIESGPKVRAKI